MSEERLTNKERISALEEIVARLVEWCEVNERPIGRDPTSTTGGSTERRGTYDADRSFGFGVRMEAK